MQLQLKRKTKKEIVHFLSTSPGFTFAGDKDRSEHEKELLKMTKAELIELFEERTKSQSKVEDKD
jgi:hypothetical protein